MIWIFLPILAASLKVDQSKDLTKIAFGSCANQFGNDNPDLYKSIQNLNPDLFIWLGDIIYSDVLVFHPPFFKTRDPEATRKMYQNFKNNTEYKALTEKTMITGIWDDHDYGINNGDKHFPLKDAYKELFLEFIDEKDNINRTSHKGIYISFSFGNNGKTVKLILLDNRYFNEKDVDILGEEQWKWLENQLKTPGDITLIASGIQVYTEDRFGKAERWDEYSRNKLLSLINDISGVILLTGDVHMAEILKITCNDNLFYEVTSSGMTHTITTTGGNLILLYLYGWLPFTFNVGHRVTVKNFGFIEIDWQFRLLKMSIRNSYGNILIEEKISLDHFSSNFERSYYCDKKPRYRKIVHVLSFWAVFYVPLLLLGIDTLIFFRKWSHSY
ncbi:unnamed protein product [Blepharisma stoltei]|uniref:PhoD-like phosphatase metallophosphatase domain-containing protein n=1 Tax=Blepharisma stoltei TaxID=1481888 RepID=A0AAU9JLK1_9CILI|nr:unnamed protein product [Blepharisma stoltei]